MRAKMRAGHTVVNGYFRADDNRYIGYHFWLYSGIVAVTEKVFFSWGGNVLKAMQVTNALCLILCLLWFAFASSAGTAVNSWTVFFYLTGGSLYYFYWTHPEVLLSACLVVGFSGLFSRQWKWSLAAFSVASLQVVSLTPLLLLVAVYFLKATRRSRRQCMVILQSNWKFLLQVFSLPLVAPLYYLFHFGEPNLIAISGAVDARLIGWNRMVSFWFDLNQGLVVGLPVFVLAVIYATYLWGRGRLRRRHELALAVGASLLIALPLLSQTNWNAGQAIFNRYALYASAPLIVFLGRFFSSLEVSRWFKAFAVSFSLAFFGLCNFALNTVPGYVSHKPWVVWVLDHYPALYNPDPEIFIERTLGREVSMADGRFVVGWPLAGPAKSKVALSDVALDEKSDTLRLTGAGSDCWMRRRDLKLDRRVRERNWTYLHDVSQGMHCAPGPI
jgi:hypothetical protein